MQIDPPPLAAVERVIALALAEDRAMEDATTQAVVSKSLSGEARLIARQHGVLAGVDVGLAVFCSVDERLGTVRLLDDGAPFEPGEVLATVSGPVAPILSAERVALNLVQRLTGIATLTDAYVRAVRGTNCLILDTRKTAPGLRELEKYAVRCGGGTNHRHDLASMAMIKDNHREALARTERSLADGVAAIRSASPGIAVEVEIDSIDDLEAALAGSPEWVLFDNMPIEEMKEAVRLCGGRAKLEASGGVTLERIADIAATGVDAVSVGALTHSAPAIDISLELSF